MVGGRDFDVSGAKHAVQADTDHEGRRAGVQAGISHMRTYRCVLLSSKQA
jgi:hypothetical protein